MIERSARFEAIFAGKSLPLSESASDDAWWYNLLDAHIVPVLHDAAEAVRPHAREVIALAGRLEVFIDRWARISFSPCALKGDFGVTVVSTEKLCPREHMSRSYITPVIIESTVEAFLRSVAGKL